MSEKKIQDANLPNYSGSFEPVSHPGHLVRRLHQICVSVFLEKAKEYDLTHIQYSAVLAIEYSPGIDQASLGRLIAADRQTTSNVVSRLASKGIIEVRQKNKKSNALYNTGAAKALLQVMGKHAPEIDRIILQPLAPEEQVQFMSLLRRLVDINNDLSRVPSSLG